MNYQRSQKNSRRPVSHRVMSTFLALLMVFTTVMPYAAFAEDSVMLGDGSGAGAVEIVGAGAGGSTEAESVIESGNSEESSLVTDGGGNAAGSSSDASASGASSSDATASGDTASGASSEDSLFGEAEISGDAAQTQTEDTAEVNPYLTEETRDIYLVNRNSYEDLQLWNENKDGDEAALWVQHVEECDTDHPYTLYGTDADLTVSASSDADDSGASADLSYRFEEIKMTDTGLKDSKGGEIYSAQIPKSWDYVTFAYFADDPDLTEGTDLDEAGYPTDVATNGRHRTMVIKVSDKKNYIVGVPLTAEEAALAGLSDGDMIWKGLEIEKKGLQAFYVNAEHFEDANGNVYRRPMAERLDATEESESETTETQSERVAETVAIEKATETVKETEAQKVTETETETATETEAQPSETVVETETVKTNEAGTEATTETEEGTESDQENTEASETTVETSSETTSEITVETSSETISESESGDVAPQAIVGPFGRHGLNIRRAPVATGYYRVYLLVKTIDSTKWKKDSAPYVYAWQNTTNNNGNQQMSVATDYESTDSNYTLYYADVLDTYSTGLLFRSETDTWTDKEQTGDCTVSGGTCFKLTSNNNNAKQTISQTSIESSTDVKAINTVKFADASKDVTHYSETSATSLGVNATTLTLTTSDDVPDKLTNSSYTITWGSSNDAAATVAGNGATATLTAVAAGSTTITATLKDSAGNTLSTATMAVTVTEGKLVSFDPTALSMTYKSTSTSNTQNVTLQTADVITNGITDGTYTVTWSSSAPETVSVSGEKATATLDAKKKGTATITATVKQGDETITSAELAVTVTEYTPQILYYLAPSSWTSCGAYCLNASGANVSSSTFTSMVYISDTSNYTVDGTAYSSSSVKDMHLFSLEVPDGATQIIFANNGAWGNGQDPANDSGFFSTTITGNHNGNTDNCYIYESSNLKGTDKTTRTTHYIALASNYWIDPSTVSMKYSSEEDNVADLTLKKSSAADAISSVSWFVVDADGNTTSDPVVEITSDATSTSGVTIKSLKAGTGKVKAVVNNDTEHPIYSTITVSEKKYVYYHADSSWTSCYAYFMNDTKSGNTYAHVDTDADDKTNGIRRLAMEQLDWEKYREDDNSLTSGNLFRVEVPDGATKVIFTNYTGTWTNTAANQDPSNENAYFNLSNLETSKNGYAYATSHGTESNDRHHLYALRTGVWINPANTEIQYVQDESNGTNLVLVKGSDVTGTITNVVWHVDANNNGIYDEEEDLAVADITRGSGNITVASLNAKGAGTVKVKADVTVKDTAGSATTLYAPDVTITITERKRIYFLAPTDSWANAYVGYAVVAEDATGNPSLDTTQGTSGWTKMDVVDTSQMAMDGGAIPDGYTLFTTLTPPYPKTNDDGKTQTAYAIFTDKGGWVSDKVSTKQDPSADNVWFTTAFGKSTVTTPVDLRSKYNNGYMYDADHTSDAGTNNVSGRQQRYFGPRQGIWITPQTTALDYAQGETHTATLTLNKGSNVGDITSITWTSDTPGVATVVSNASNTNPGDGKLVDDLTATVTSKSGGTAIIKATVTARQADGTTAKFETTFDTGENADQLKNTGAKVDVTEHNYIYYLAPDDWTECYAYFMDKDGKKFTLPTDYQNAHKDAIDTTGNVTRVKMDALTTSDYFEDNAGIESGNLFRIEVPAGAKQVIFTSHAGNWDGSESNKNEGKQDPTANGAAFSLDLKGTAKDKAKGTTLTDADGNALKNNGYQYDSDNHSTGKRTEHYFGAPQGTYLDPSTVTLRRSGTGDSGVAEEKELKLHTELTYGTDYDKVVWTTTDANGTYVKIIDKNDESATVKAVSKTGNNGPVTITATLYKGSTVVDTAVAKITVSDKLVIYYDAAFSKLAYKAGDGKDGSEIPKSDGTINYTIKYVDNNNVTQTVTGSMTKVPTSDVPSSAKGSWTDIYKTAELDNVKEITSVVFRNTTGFATKESVNTDTSTTDYEKIKYDATLTNPCFYADTGDNINYISSGNRGGYWGELWETRDKSSSVLANANKSSDQTDKKTVVGTDQVTNIVDGTYPGNSTDGNTIYVNSSFYDYLSDYELNGLSRGNYPGDNGVSQRNWVTFREFDQALSGYYSANRTAYPMYTGHFQPPVSGWGTQFQEIGYTMGLYGYTAGNIPGDKFYTVNNSSTDSSGNAGFYNYATQGLFNIAQSTYFNTDFLSGNNNKHAKLANIYPSVKFPMTKTNENVMHKTGSDTKSVEYYVFDSAETTLHIAGKTGQKYLANMADRSWSTNVTSGGTAGSDKNQSVSNTYGFFPLDDTTGSNGKLGTGVDHNYGFGAKITIPFTVSSDGMTNASDGTKVPQIFKFSGDDDIWIFIDGDLALDLGGDHGRVYGAINFAKESASSNYTRVDFKDNGGKTIWKNVQNAHNYVSYVKTVNGLSSYAVDQSNDVSGILNGHNVYDGKTHYMTIYYMERGQWESNMRMEMSLKPVVSVDVTKKFVGSDGTTDITDQMTSGRVFAMVTRKYKTGTDASGNATYSDPEIYPVNSSAKTTAEKYCLELSKENGWTNSLTQLQQYHNDNQNEPYVYTVTEALMNNGQLALSTAKDTAGVNYPIEAKTGDTVTVDGKTFIVQPATSSGDSVNTSYELTNKQTTPTSVKVEKRFVNTTEATRPNGIKIKLQRAVVGLKDSNGAEWTDTTLADAVSALTDDKWSNVTVDGQEADGWFLLDDTESATSNGVTTWSHTFENLARDEVSGSTVTGRYVYRVVEASSLTKTQTNDDGSTSTVAPDQAADSSTVTYGSNSYIVYYSGTDNEGKANWVIAPTAPSSGSTDTTQPTVTLTNKRQPKVDLEVKKIFTGTDDDASTRPESIRFKVQRAIIANYNSTTNKLTVPSTMTEKTNARQNDWKDLTAADLNETTATLPSENGWFVWTPSSNTETWTKVFSGLPIQPSDATAGEYYVYRVVEATDAASTATEAANGETVTYSNGDKSNSYWVRYSDGTYTNVYLPVTVTRSGTSGSYSYDATVNKKGEGSSSTEGGTAVMVNTLIVHLPSTGSRSAMTLTILSLICLAAAGSFGIFSRKRRYKE